MTAPTYNLIIFLVVALFVALLLWPRLGFVQAVRGRFRITKRTQLEDALKFIHNSQLNNEAVTVGSLTNALGIVEAKSSGLTDHICRSGLATLADGRIQLTDEGEQYALQIVRAHRLWERYLADETGVDPREWHTQAEKIEHTISREEVETLAERLGNPLFDPHGDPIPTADGEYEAQELISMSELTVGQCARVQHMEDEPENLFEELVNLGIYPGMEFCLKSMSGENFMIEADGRMIELAPVAAGNLSVDPIEKIAPVKLDPNRETLDKLRAGETAKIVQISPVCHGYERRRLMDLGLVPSTVIKFYEHGLTGGLRAFSIRGTVLALRDEQIRMISISDRRRVTA